MNKLILIRQNGKSSKSLSKLKQKHWMVCWRKKDYENHPAVHLNKEFSAFPKKNHAYKIVRLFRTKPFNFEINVGKGRIRHTTTLKLNDKFLDRLKIDWTFKFRVVICRIRPFPTLISKMKWSGSELPLILIFSWKVYWQRFLLTV